MILLLDVGNSRSKWQLRAGSEILDRGDCATGEMAEMRRAWARHGFDRALASCVAGASTRESLTGLIAECGSGVVWLQAAAMAHGLINRYQSPERLGPDRYAGLIAAHRMGLRDCVVVSVGTALTADMLTGDGEFLGGCILPGPELMRRALATGTAQVELAQATLSGDACPREVLPRDTAAAVATGIGLAMAGVVRGMRERLALTAGGIPVMVLTGGASAELRPWLDGEVVAVDDLVLEGLAWIARDLACDD